MPSLRTTRRSAAAAAQQLEQEQSTPPPPPAKKSGGKKAAASTSKSKPAPAAPPKSAKKATTKKSRAKRDPSPTPTPTPSPTPSPPPPPPTTGKGKKKGRPPAAVAVEEKPTTSTAAATTNSRKKKQQEEETKKEKKKTYPVPDYLQAPGRSRSCFADTSVNNKWNFGPALSCGRRKRDEIEFFEPKVNESGESRVKKNFKKGTIKFEMDVIHPFVMCRLCDGYLIDATTIIDCMHTFCKSCLLLYFEDDENTCPTCGILIHGSHPAQYVTFDRAINDLVMQLVPNLEADEKRNRREFLNSFRDIDYEAEERKKQEAKEEERRRGTNRCYRGGDPEVSHHRDDNMVMVKLVPGCKDLPLTARPFIRTSEMTTINTLKKYLALTLWDNQNKYSELDIFCDNQLMGKDFSIRFVWMMKRRQQPKHIPLELQYRNTIN